MTDRPPIGARVTVLGNSGLKRRDLGVGTVVAYFEDGIAFKVAVDGGRTITADPCNVELEGGRMASARFRGEYAANRKEIHNAVRAEAGHRCIRCGHPEGDTFATRMPCDERCTHPADGKMRILTVHHLTGQKDDNRWWNLLALCQSCHLTIQGRVIPERPWLFEHSRWFVPYVCGFYASYYGGVEITREQADAEPDRWLKLGQPWRHPEETAHA